MADAGLRGLVEARGVGGNDLDLRRRQGDVAQQQRQHALADAAETEQNDAPGVGMALVRYIQWPSPSLTSCARTSV
ncbi:hypothetical protein D3C85_1557530 [compost metagenome]